MRTLGNIIWHFPCFGFISAGLTYLIGGILTLTVVGAPIGLGLMELGKFLFMPFGNAMVSATELGKNSATQNKVWSVLSVVMMVVYFPIGLVLSILIIVQIACLFLSVVGIPPALVLAKSLGTFLNPVNKKCVRSAVAEEIERNKAKSEVAKYAM